MYLDNILSDFVNVYQIASNLTVMLLGKGHLNCLFEYMLVPRGGSVMVHSHVQTSMLSGY